MQAWEQVEGKVQKRREDVSFHLMLQEIDWNVLWQQQSPMDMSNSFNTIQTIELGNIDFASSPPLKLNFILIEWCLVALKDQQRKKAKKHDDQIKEPQHPNIR